MPRPLSVFLPICMLGACATAPPPTAADPRMDAAPLVAGIVLCESTEAELRQRFGAPTRDGRLRDARVLSWITEGDDENGDGIIRYLAVMLDAGGKVVDLYWNLPTEIPWTPADQCKPR